MMNGTVASSSAASRGIGARALDREAETAPWSESSFSEQELLAALRQNPVFARCSDESLAKLLVGAVALDVGARQGIFEEGSVADHYYVLIEGVIRVFHRCGDERQVTVKHLVPPTTFGDIEVLTGQPFIESTEALAPSRLVRLRADAFKEFLDTHHECARELLQLVCTRYCMAARNEHALFFDVQARLASLFLTYADLFGKRASDGVRIHLSLTYEDLANGVGIVRRSVTRTLGEWRDRGIVTRRKGWFVLHDVPKLEEMCRGLRFPGAPSPGR